MSIVFTLFCLAKNILAIMSSDFKLEQKAYIKIRTLHGFAPNDVLADLDPVNKDVSLSFSTMKDWAKLFVRGRGP